MHLRFNPFCHEMANEFVPVLDQHHVEDIVSEFNGLRGGTTNLGPGRPALCRVVVESRDAE